MRAIDGVWRRAAGPLVSISLCGITSLSTTVIEPPRRSVTACCALNWPPFSDQLWQPRSWWRMTSEAWLAGEAAVAPPTTIAAAATAARIEFVCLIITLVLPSSFCRLRKDRVCPRSGKAPSGHTLNLAAGFPQLPRLRWRRERSVERRPVAGAVRREHRAHVGSVDR